MAHTAAAAAAAAIVPATVAARGARLTTKAQQGRRTDDIALLMPAGAAAMKSKPSRPAFPDGVGGDKAWAEMRLGQRPRTSSWGWRSQNV